MSKIQGSDKGGKKSRDIDRDESTEKIEWLYDKYSRLVYVVANKFVGHHEDAEDVLMLVWETMIKCVDRIEDIKDPKVKGLIVLITERRAIDFLRKRYKNREIEMLTDIIESSPFYATMDQHYEMSEITEVIRHLPKKYAEVLSLYYIYGFNGNEMAEILEVKMPAVMKRLQRARACLKQELEEAGVLEPEKKRSVGASTGQKSISIPVDEEEEKNILSGSEGYVIALNQT